MRKSLKFLLIVLTLFLLVGCRNTEEVYADEVYIEKLGITTKEYNQILKALDKKEYKYDLRYPIDSVIKHEDFYQIYARVGDLTHFNPLGYEFLEDIIFPNSATNQMHIYKNGKIYTLTEAYEKKLIDKDDLIEIYVERFYKVNDPYEIATELKNPQQYYMFIKNYYQKNNMEMDKELIAEYCASWIVDISNISDSYLITMPIDKVNVYEYTYELVNGVLFRTYKGIKLVIYHQDNYYSLQEAYDNGIIDDDNILTIYEKNERYLLKKYKEYEKYNIKKIKNKMED
ncbi:MAG: hypothetical protein IJX78_07630 [Bacilli bacterium]|nr:hypothetical protein [Bacilli bacterium]